MWQVVQSAAFSLLIISNNWKYQLLKLWLKSDKNNNDKLVLKASLKWPLYITKILPAET